MRKKKKNEKRKKKKKFLKENLPVKLNDAVAFGFCVSMWAPPRSKLLGTDCDHAPGGEYVIIEVS